MDALGTAPPGAFSFSGAGNQVQKMKSICLPICRLMNDMGFCQREIAECYGVSRDVIQYRLSDKCKSDKSFVIKEKNQSRANCNWRCTRCGALVAMLYSFGFSYIEIKEQLNCSNNYLCKSLRQHGLTRKDKLKITASKITELNNNGLNDTQIANILGTSQSAVSKYRRKLGLPTRHETNEERHNDAMKTIQKHVIDVTDGSFEVVRRLEGYSRYRLKCLSCGHEFDRSVDKRCTPKCPECERTRKEREYWQHEFNQPCLHLVFDSKKKVDRSKTVKCLECGEEFIIGDRSSNKIPKFCSDKCSHKHNGRKARHIRRDRLGDTGERPTWRQLYKDGQHHCYLCGCEVNPLDFRRDEKGSFIAGSTYPSLDHVIPLSRGGRNTFENSKIACFKCNSLKGAKTCEEYKEVAE